MTTFSVDTLRGIKGYWYVATPYSKWVHGIDDACEVAQKITGQLMLARVPCYSPIAETHGISRWIKDQVDPRDHDFWLDADKPKFESAHGLLVANLSGWRESLGVLKEISWCKEMGKPHWLLNPATLDYTKLPAV